MPDQPTDHRAALLRRKPIVARPLRVSAPRVRVSPRPLRYDQTQTMMAAAEHRRRQMGRLSASPPSLTGLSRKSPKVAPKGRVRMNAIQNKIDARNPGPEVQRRDHREGRAKTSAPPRYPSPVSSAIQSPRAVPSVWENVIVAQ